MNMTSTSSNNDDSTVLNTNFDSNLQDSKQVTKIPINELPANLEKQPKKDIWKFYSEINNGKKNIRVQFVHFVTNLGAEKEHLI